jgi:hypothetical protein
LAERVWGGRRTIVWAGKMSDKKLKIKKYIVALSSRQLKISNATTNQKHAGETEEWKARRFDQGGAWGKRDSIVWGAIELGGDKNLYKINEFTNYFFSWLDGTII